MKKLLFGIAILFGAMAFVVGSALADSVSVTFESPTYSVGNIEGQDGWMKTGAFDAAVVSNTYGYATFGGQSLRISDAVTSGSFGDQTFAKPLVNAVGESTATDGGFPVGTRQTHFEMQFDLASTLSALQPGMHISISPDRGDGSRMSYLRFEDQADGIHVFFDDATDPGPVGTVANFSDTDIATITRAPHTIKLTMDTPEGPANDIVNVYVDGTLIKTGTTWEDYYRYDPESSADQHPRLVRTVLFRESGTANETDQGNGFLIDNFSTNSSTPQTVTAPTITFPANGATVTTSALTHIDWTDATGGSGAPYQYQYEAYSDAAYTSLIYQSGWLSTSDIATPNTPPGDYYIRVKARDSSLTESDWSNGADSAYVIHVIADTTPTPTPTDTVTPTPIGPPTNMDQCKNGGWQTFTNPTFRNQGLCVSYVVSNHH